RPVVRERDRLDLPGVAVQRRDELAVGDVPELDGPVGRTRGEPLAVTRQVDGEDGPGVTRVVLQGRPVVEVPEPGDPIVRGRDETLAVRGDVAQRMDL